MEEKMLIRAGMKRHKGSLTGIFILTLIVALALTSVLTIWTNSGGYVRAEMNRAGFGGLTVWVSNILDLQALKDELTDLEEVDRVGIQRIIYSNYEFNGQESDSEGQLISYRAQERRYRFFLDDLSGYRSDTPEISAGEVYVPPSTISMFGVHIGDEMIFPVARNGQEVALTVKGYYEDPFMGSSMIGMKGFLISDADRVKILQIINNAGIDALARDGAMLHIFQADENMSSAELGTLLNENTELARYTEFFHSAAAISGFMLILHNAFCGLLTAFAGVLLGVTMVVISHSLTSTLESDYVNISILKTLGFSEKKLKKIQTGQYLLPIAGGLACGLASAVPFLPVVTRATLPSAGILVPAKISLKICFLCAGLIFVLLIAVLQIKIRNISRITPMGAIRNEAGDFCLHPHKTVPVRGKMLFFRLVLRQLASGKKRYFSTCIVAVLLVFFASLVGRMNDWLGPDGKGMMDAFNPADHDLGVQIFGDFEIEAVEAVIHGYSETTEHYLLAMPDVSINGRPYTANVITEPQRFHMMEGKTSRYDDEIVLTESAAADLGVSIGDLLTVTGSLGQAQYTVSGIYSCANDMGDNIGMSREGYQKIGQEDSRIWCFHYFLADPSQKGAIIQAIKDTFGGDVHVHENTWPGLSGIISAMQGMLICMYGLVFVFILIVTILTGSKILAAEQNNLTIYRAIGFSAGRLRWNLAVRFLLVATVGAMTGTVLAAVLTDPFVSAVMKQAGISNFESHSGIAGILFPGFVVVVLFTVFAYLAAGRIKRTSLSVLISKQ